MLLRCDEPGGDRSIVNCEAIESLHVERHEDQEIFRLVVVTYNGPHYYGQYLTEEEAYAARDYVAQAIADEEQPAPPTPSVAEVPVPALLQELLRRRHQEDDHA